MSQSGSDLSQAAHDSFITNGVKFALFSSCQTFATIQSRLTELYFSSSDLLWIRDYFQSRNSHGLAKAINCNVYIIDYDAVDISSQCCVKLCRQPERSKRSLPMDIGVQSADFCSTRCTFLNYYFDTTFYVENKNIKQLRAHRHNPSHIVCYCRTANGVCVTAPNIHVATSDHQAGVQYFLRCVYS